MKLSSVKKTIDTNSKKGRITDTYYVQTLPDGTARMFIALGYNIDKNVIVYFFDRVPEQGDGPVSMTNVELLEPEVQEKIFSTIGDGHLCKDSTLQMHRTEAHLNNNLDIISRLGLYYVPVDEYDPWDALSKLEEGSYAIDRDFRYHKINKLGSVLGNERYPAFLVSDTGEYITIKKGDVGQFEEKGYALSSAKDMVHRRDGYAVFDGNFQKYCICESLEQVKDITNMAFFGGNNPLRDENGVEIPLLGKAWFINKAQAIPFFDTVKNAKTKISEFRDNFLVFGSMEDAMAEYTRINDAMVVKFMEMEKEESEKVALMEEECPFKGDIYNPSTLKKGVEYTLCDVATGERITDFTVDTIDRGKGIITDAGVIVVPDGIDLPIVKKDEFKLFYDNLESVKQIMIHKGVALRYNEAIETLVQFRPFYDDGAECPWAYYYEAYKLVTGYGENS